MFMLMIVALYSAVNVYLARRIIRWLRTMLPRMKAWPVAVIYGLLAATIVMPLIRGTAWWQRALTWVGAHWMGVFVYLLLFWVLADVITLVVHLLRRRKGPLPVSYRRTVGWLVMVLTVSFCGYGIWNARQIRSASYTVQVDDPDLGGDMRLALVSDLHLGAIGSEDRLETIVAEINALQPDLVLIAGDLFDNDFTAIRDPQRVTMLFRDIQATHGVYACLGNHDSGVTAVLMRQLLQDGGVVCLNDSMAVIDDRLALVGRLDGSPIGGYDGLTRADGAALMRQAAQTNLPVLVMDHNPSHISEYGRETDLIVSGHTHRGQIFPANLITDMMYTVDYGYYRADENSPQVIVTSGAGIWGLPMRVGTQCEVVTITLTAAP